MRPPRPQRHLHVGFPVGGAVTRSPGGSRWSVIVPGTAAELEVAGVERPHVDVETSSRARSADQDVGPLPRRHPDVGRQILVQPGVFGAKPHFSLGAHTTSRSRYTDHPHADSAKLREPRGTRRRSCPASGDQAASVARTRISPSVAAPPADFAPYPTESCCWQPAGPRHSRVSPSGRPRPRVR